MENLAEIEISFVIDEDGDYAIGKDLEAAAEAYADDVNGSALRRAYTLKLHVPLPKPTEVTGALPDTEGEVTLTIA